ncbi:MAG: IPT/TIG domain-containing protein [Opitutaceae bacterium]|jgi:sugar lactone lactonase YvrE|nr:IPT/TIG domain-containing protein [Opitutaceae bacterium]
MKTKSAPPAPPRRADKTQIVSLAACLAALVSATSAAPMDSTTLTDFDFSTAQQNRTQTLLDNGTLELRRILTGPTGASAYRHMGWPVATRLPDGRTVVLIRNLKSHSGYDSQPDNARRVIWSDDNMTTWQPASPLANPPPLGVNTGGDITTLGNYDYKGMHALSWAVPPGSTAPRLVAITAKHDVAGTPSAKAFRVYLSEDRGATWREQPGALAGLSYDDAVHCGPNIARHPEFGLVVPFGQPSNTNKNNAIARSADAGGTWEIQKWTNAAASRSIEPAIATWGAGHMVMIGRERMDAYGHDTATGKYYYTQHVYQHTPGAPFSAVTFTTARTNIAGNGKTPVAKGKNGYEAHDTADIIHNPVTGRIEMIQSSRWGAGAENPLPATPENPTEPVNALNLWSIDPVDLLAGGATWRFDGNLVERQGIILGAVGLPKDNKDGYHPGGSIVDEAAGKQHIFIYVGVYTQYANAYRLSRPLDTYAFRAACGLPPLPAPAITGITDIADDNTVTLTGLNFTALKEVLVGGKTATVSTSSATQIKLTIPVGAATGAKITVRTDNGIVTSDTGIVLPDHGVAASPLAPAGIAAAAGASAPALYIADAQNHVVLRVTQPGGATAIFAGQPGAPGALDGDTASARLREPRGLAINAAGALVIADTGNSRIRLVTGRTITPAGAGALNRPHALAAHDTNGDTYIADTGNHRIQKINAAGILSTVAGSGLAGFADGPAPAARFRSPKGIAVDAAGNLYVADTGNHAIRYIDTASGSVSTLAGQPGSPGHDDGPAPSAKFNAPEGVTVDADGDVFVADTGNSRIREIHSGAVATLAGSAPGFHDDAGAAAQFDAPSALVIAEDGNLYIADPRNRAVRRLTPDNTVSTIISGTAPPDTPAAGGAGGPNNSGSGGGAPTRFLAAALLALLAARARPPRLFMKRGRPARPLDAQRR